MVVRAGYRNTTRVSNGYSCTGTEVTGGSTETAHSLVWGVWPKPVIHEGLMILEVLLSERGTVANEYNHYSHIP